MAAALLTFALGAALFRGATDPPAPRHIGMIAAVLLGERPRVVAEAHIAKTDAALLAAITAARARSVSAYVRGRTGRPYRSGYRPCFWSAEIAAIFLKGPPGPALAVTTVAALAIADRELRWLRGLHPMAGTLLLVVAIAPWLVAIERATEGRFLGDALGHDLMMKLIGAQNRTARRRSPIC